MSDPLADLGLDIEDNAAAPAAEASTEAAAEGAKAPREEVEIGELEFGTLDFIPTSKRGGPSGSKYEFDKLAAPVAKESGDGWNYSYFFVKLLPDVDPDKLKRSVQSATTSANRGAKDEKSDRRFITRTVLKDGDFVGINVIRVDATLDNEE